MPARHGPQDRDLRIQHPLGRTGIRCGLDDLHSRDLLAEQEAGHVDLVHQRILDDQRAVEIAGHPDVAVHAVHHQRSAQLAAVDQRLQADVLLVEATHEPDLDQRRAPVRLRAGRSPAMWKPRWSAAFRTGPVCRTPGRRAVASRGCCRGWRARRRRHPGPEMASIGSETVRQPSISEAICSAFSVRKSLTTLTRAPEMRDVMRVTWSAPITPTPSTATRRSEMLTGPTA